MPETDYIATMHWGRRVLAALSAALVLQLVFVGSGYACSRSDGRASMADMGMGSTDQHHVPCRFPWAPDGCQNMVPCAPAAIAVPTNGVLDLQPLVAPVLVLSVVTPPSVNSPPELPPPRA
jgi:hypothetical protein